MPFCCSTTGARAARRMPYCPALRRRRICAVPTNRFKEDRRNRRRSRRPTARPPVILSAILRAMRVLFLSGLLAVARAAQTPKLPADIDPQSFSRLPFIHREQVSGDALRVYDGVAGKDASGKD